MSLVLPNVENVDDVMTLLQSALDVSVMTSRSRLSTDSDISEGAGALLYSSGVLVTSDSVLELCTSLMGESCSLGGDLHRDCSKI